MVTSLPESSAAEQKMLLQICQQLVFGMLQAGSSCKMGDGEIWSMVAVRGVMMLVAKLCPFLWFCNFPLSLTKASDEDELLVESALEILQQLGLVQKGSCNVIRKGSSGQIIGAISQYVEISACEML